MKSKSKNEETFIVGVNKRIKDMNLKMKLILTTTTRLRINFSTRNSSCPGNSKAFEKKIYWIWPRFEPYFKGSNLLKNVQEMKKKIDKIDFTAFVLTYHGSKPISACSSRRVDKFRGITF